MCPVCDKNCNILKNRQEIMTTGINLVKPGYWIRLNDHRPVCFQTRGNSPGIIKTSYDGFIGAIKLIYLHGSISCDRRNRVYQSYWGCSNNPDKRHNNLNIFLTDSNSNQLLIKKQDLNYSWYSSEIFTPISPEFVFESMSKPQYVYKGFELQLWYGDDKKDRNEQFSEGETCVDVYAHFV